MSDSQFDPAEAMALLGHEERRVRAALDPGLPLTFLAWGVAWLVGFGGIWWQVRGQEPYTGPQGVTAILFAVLLTAAAIFTGWRTQRAVAGIGGKSARRGHLFGAGWFAGFLALFAILGALSRLGATADVMGVLGVCGPLLVVGLMYLFGAACFGSQPMAGLGSWMLALAAGLGFAGPVTAAGLAALLAGGGFLLTALVATRRGGQ